MSKLQDAQPLPSIAGDQFEIWFDALSDAQKTSLESMRPTLEPLFNGAPYLAEVASKNADWLCDVLNVSTDDVASEIFAVLERAGCEETEEDVLSSTLREAKARIALLAAIAETGGVWSSAQSTAALADLADVALEACLNFLIREAAGKGIFADSYQEPRADNSGLAIFALGKHGGRELNYSSDIDIVAFYDPEQGVLADFADAAKFYTRLVRNMVRLMDERTTQGYVFRTDMRLRPDPGATPVAISVYAALGYYESRGQNWERAAWIKARHCAGDGGIAADFLQQLKPFIWRRHLDFAAIADIQAMKRQINVSKDVGAARVGGHNVKLGRGGIREIEFFTQTQQLIAGGRDTELRARPTADALDALANSGWISQQTTTELTETYWFLRAVENRLQMVRDEQTHIMPEDEESLTIIAKLMGDDGLAQFEQRYRQALAMVMGYYADLFTEQQSLAGDAGDLVFTGSDDDPETLDTLQTLGFADAPLAAKTIRKWHYGSYPATRAAAARAHLTELLPGLLTSIAATRNADAALARFDHFLSRFPAGVQLFSLLRNNNQICDMLVALMASAPRLADAVIHRAHVMDGLIDPAFADGVTRTDVLVDKVDDFLQQARSFEDLIDRARIIGQEQKFLIAAGFVSGTVDGARAGAQFTALAETLLERLFGAVQAEFSERHGTIPGARAGLLGFGKMASREMTATSDLDFILLYDVPDSSAMSDGAKPLASAHYYARLTQRLVAALSAPTAEGVLYEADMRLRPSGNAGPLATSLSSFVEYQLKQAWTWEHLALTRARPITGNNALGREISTALETVLDRDFDRRKVVNNVVDMRAKMVAKRQPRHHFDLKLTNGGLVDIEFIAQSAQLLYRQDVAEPYGNIDTILSQLSVAELLPEAEKLREIFSTYTTILQAMSICLPDPFKEEWWQPSFKELLAQLTNYPDFQRLEESVQEMFGEVRAASESWYQRAAE